MAATFTVFFGTVFPLLSEAVRGVKVSVGRPSSTRSTCPLFLGLLFLMGVGPLIAWRRASVENLRRNFLWPVLAGVVAAAVAVRCWACARRWRRSRSRRWWCSSPATIAVDLARATRARRRTGELARPPAMGGLLRRQNRRYGGFVVHLGILVIALGVTGSQAWSVQTETTLRRGESAELAGYRVRFDGLAAAEESNHFKVAGTFTVSNGRDLAPVLLPAKKFYPPGADADRLRRLPARPAEDVYLVLGDFARDGCQATVKVQVNRMVIWIWIGGFILTLGRCWRSCPRRRHRRESGSGAG